MAKPRFLYDNRFDDATPEASSTAAGNFAVANLADWRPYTWWKPAAIPATVTVDSGSAKARDFFLVYGDAGEYEARGSTDNFAASDVLLASITLAKPGLAVAFFTSASHRYTRLEIPSGSAPAVGIASIGAALEVPNTFERDFDPLRRQVFGSVNRNENGRSLGRVIDFEQWQARLMFTMLERTWLRDSFLPAWEAHLRSTPFGFVWDADYPEDVRLVNAGDEIEGPHYFEDHADLVMQVKGAIL